MSIVTKVPNFGLFALESMHNMAASWQIAKSVIVVIYTKILRPFAF